MNDIYKALGDISLIRRQMATTAEFRGYGPATLAATGVFALIAAVAQRRFIPDPADHLRLYLALWIVTALVSAVLTGAQMYTRSRRIHSGLSNQMLRMAVEQFLPSAGAGLLITIVLAHNVPSVAWMLPSLWQIMFSLGVLSSCRFLPKAIIAVGAWYLLTGLSCLAVGNGHALSPWNMGIPFGVGQLMVAAILYLSAPKESYED